MQRAAKHHEHMALCLGLALTAAALAGCQGDAGGEGALSAAATGTLADTEAACPCNGPWRDHEQFVNCVTEAARELQLRGLISSGQRNHIIDEAEASSCGTTGECPGLGAFRPVGDLLTPRFFHSTTQLRDGTVLIAGGTGPDGAPVATAEIYDWLTASFQPTGNMVIPRSRHRATLLANGTVLITGGTNIFTDHDIAQAEIYDPVTGTFRPTAGRMNLGRILHTATRLNDGRVLIAGGFSSITEDGVLIPGPERTLNHAEIYNPATETFTVVGTLNQRRSRHEAVALNQAGGNLVLIAGGAEGSTGVFDSGELFDPSSNTFRLANTRLSQARRRPTLTRVRRGDVIILGGHTGTAQSAAGDIYDPRRRVFRSTGSLTLPRDGHLSVLLEDDTILTVGGFTNDPTLTEAMSAEIYDPTTGESAFAADMSVPRDSLGVTALSPQCRVLVTGGTMSLGGEVHGSAELFWPCSCDR